MKILLTVHQFFPDFKAGTEVLTLSVAKELVARGHEVRILTGHPSKAELADHERFDEYVFEGIQIYRFHHAYVPMAEQLSSVEIGYENLLLNRFCSTLLSSYSPDIVHIFHLNRLGTGVIPIAKESGVPVFMTPTDFWAVCPSSQLIYLDGKPCNGPSRNAGNCINHFAFNRFKKARRLISEIPSSLTDLGVDVVKAAKFFQPSYVREMLAMERRLSLNVERLNKLNYIFAPNKMMQEVFLRLGISQSKVGVYAYGINVEYVERRQPVVKQDGPLRLGFIGTLAPHKGCHVLLRAFKNLMPGTATLDIYGDEGDFPEYATFLRELAGSNRSVRFCGNFPNEKIGEILDSLNVLVVPSLWNENTPLVIYSAQAAGCPILASNVPGISEVVKHEVDGLLFEVGNAEELTKHIRFAISDRAKLSRIGALAKSPKPISVYVDELWEKWGARYCN